MIVLMYKEAYFAINEFDVSLLSVFMSLLKEDEDLFPKEVLEDLPPLRRIQHQIDFCWDSWYIHMAEDKNFKHEIPYMIHVIQLN